MQSLSEKYQSTVPRGQALSVLCLIAQLQTSKSLQGARDFKAKQVRHALTEYGARRKTHSLSQS
nr:MAG TPA: hypothetical protein [Caudoviricetes sp.]